MLDGELLFLVSRRNYRCELKLVLNDCALFANLDFRALLRDLTREQVPPRQSPVDNLRPVFDAEIPITFGARLWILTT